MRFFWDWQINIKKKMGFSEEATRACARHIGIVSRKKESAARPS